MFQSVRLHSFLTSGALKGDLQLLTGFADASDLLKGWKIDGCEVRVVDIPKTDHKGSNKNSNLDTGLGR